MKFFDMDFNEIVIMICFILAVLNLLNNLGLLK